MAELPTPVPAPVAFSEGVPEAQSFPVPAQVTGRFHLRAGAPPAPLLVGFHGYGENASRHLSELRLIPGLERWSLAAVEALHPFYTRQGEVVRSWMTRVDREAAIADNVAYVTSVLARISELAPYPFWVACGFSQGAGMAWRAAAGARPECRAVVALGGDLPPELDPSTLASRRVLIGRGESDEWYTAEKLAADRARLGQGGIDPEICELAGGHEWTDTFREAAGRFLRALDGPLG